MTTFRTARTTCTYADIVTFRGTEAMVYRSRLVVLVILAAAAACSTRDDSTVVTDLPKDTTLARLSVNQQGAEPLPSACGTIAASATSRAVNALEAKELARQAYSSEVLGRVQEARSLLKRAFELDGTDESVAYHLGRTSEELGDRGGAVTAYCRYLTLASGTTGAADARQRVARLSQPRARVASSSKPQARAAAVISRARDVRRTHSVASATTDPAPDDGAYQGASNGDVAVASSSDVPPIPQPVTPVGARRRGPTRVQGADVGAVAGAIIGAATGRSVKSAVIGAAAGGILGTVVAGASQRGPG